jgi:hypothetical protein
MSTPVPSDNHITKDVLSPIWQAWFASISRTLLGLSGTGTTAKRPTASLFVGYGPYYDTSIGKPVWVKSLGPTVWQDASGATV